MLSFVTNATLNDAIRLEIFIPHILNVFGTFVDEIIVILDTRAEEGRIKSLHSSNAFVTIADEQFLLRLKSLDKRIKIFNCDYTRVDEISIKWFGRPSINRCQAGTPIFAFLFGIENCNSDCIIRSDCDIFFYNNGFLEQLLRNKSADLIQLPMLNDDLIPFSSRSFYIDRTRVEARLPLKAYRLDLLRRLHRFMKNRSSYMALEQIFQLNIDNDKIHVERQTTRWGYSMHISKREYFTEPYIHDVERSFRLGQVPEAQLRYKHDFHRELWR
jgi:hypothetical protein